MALFEVKRPYPGQRISLVYESAAKRGVAIQADTTTPSKGALATGDYLGFLTRDVVATLDVAERAVWPGRLELPFIAGGQVSIERADAIEAEGTDYLVTSGTGALAAETSLGTDLSFASGKLRVKQSGDRAVFKLREVQTPEVAGNLRIFAEAIR